MRRRKAMRQKNSSDLLITLFPDFGHKIHKLVKHPSSLMINGVMFIKYAAGVKDLDWNISDFGQGILPGADKTGSVSQYNRIDVLNRIQNTETQQVELITCSGKSKSARRTHSTGACCFCLRRLRLSCVWRVFCACGKLRPGEAVRRSEKQPGAGGLLHRCRHLYS